MRQPDAVPLLDILENSEPVIVPHLYFAECANALWKYVSHSLLDTEQSVGRLEELMSLPNEIVDDQSLAVEALSLASLHNHPVYDMLYIVLARRHACGLLTKDKRLANLATQLGITVFPARQHYRVNKHPAQAHRTQTHHTPHAYGTVQLPNDSCLGSLKLIHGFL
ncbi:type II toxin-antitoxin system VapC family toxin [Thiothrix fructosivorans]|uniref:Type II toxin-antitoxin system VapC family toxin n=1 Tax=Thiothrix fructosivorans TaxID=111770 RepID=A0A8B0SHH3_9GAMM|nr:type II toxin-antitoxin system VapC family toxin [Thiothrix fructosivorans]MBO0615116.1 type II toxin-antitoxin system VapC family toxin [Thiothrix fructosivorans]QTX09910.1 type II toxin-antitoxin system VapC family toxin [Thiothrix fructosivorans]